MSANLSGILPAIVTPFTAEGAFHPAAMEKLLDRLYAAGVHGVYVLGQTGEGILTPPPVRKQVAEFVLRNSPKDRCVIIHTGAPRTADAVELTRHASSAGAHAVSSLPPAGNYTFAEVRAYYEAVAGVSACPVLVYYFPEVSASIASADQILDLCSIPNVVGLKFTDFDLFKLSRIALSGLTIFNGRDEVLAAGMLMGAHGGIGTFYNLLPHEFVEVYGHARAGRWAEARRVQDRINELIALTLRFPPFPAVKKMLEWSGIECGRCIAPRRALTPAEEAALRDALAAANFNPDGFLRERVA